MRYARLCLKLFKFHSVKVTCISRLPCASHQRGTGDSEVKRVPSLLMRHLWASRRHRPRDRPL